MRVRAMPGRWKAASIGAATLVVASACSGDDDGVTDVDDDVTDVEETTDDEVTGIAYDGPPVELDFWNGFTGQDGPHLLEIVERFNEEHDNINVTVNTIEWADYYGTVPGAVRAGEGPHVGIMHLNEVATAAARGVILPLDDLANALEWDASDFSPPIWEAGVYDGQRFGIPLDVHPQAFYYNRTLMEEAGLDPDAPPETADDYMAALDALRDSGIDGHWVEPGSSWWFQGLLAQFGGSLYNEDVTEVTWNSEAGVQALEWLVNLIDEGYSPSDAGSASSAFEAGDVAFVWNGVWFIGGLQDNDELDWGVAPVPVVGDQPGVWASSHNFVLMNLPDLDDDTRMASYVFMDWVSTESLQWAEAGQVPARASVYESEEFQALEAQATVATQLDDVAFQPSVPGIADVSTEMDQAVEDAILGVKSPQEALDDAAVRGNELLQQNREQFGDWASDS